MSLGTDSYCNNTICNLRIVTRSFLVQLNLGAYIVDFINNILMMIFYTYLYVGRYFGE